MKPSVVPLRRPLKWWNWKKYSWRRSQTCLKVFCDMKSFFGSEKLIPVVSTCCYQHGGSLTQDTSITARNTTAFPKDTDKTTWNSTRTRECLHHLYTFTTTTKGKICFYILRRLFNRSLGLTYQEIIRCGSLLWVLSHAEKRETQAERFQSSFAVLQSAKELFLFY